MPIQLAEEAIAVLHDLAQRGEIDPWDVQVIEVIDRYLSKIPLNSAFSHHPLDNHHLPQSGQAFVWASMLVLLKANTLEEQADAEDDELTLVGEDLAFVALPELPSHLEHHIRRRPTVPPVRRRRVTLNELIQQIQQMARLMETQLPRQRKRRLGYSRREATQQISQLAHDENLNETAERLEALLHDRLPLSDETDQSSISLEQLVQWWAESQAHSPSTHDRVGVFWALLLLCSQSKVELQQASFYQDLEIKPLIVPISP
ncbi:MAG: segregation/condensation protein A [Spirulina sp. SIO3F2]|nr:segregation/condensation protein A [Spirulina sp. SIO3F2]